MTPEEKLCSRSWRLRNSAGLLWSMLSFGMLTGVGFLIRGMKSKNKVWIAMGVGFLVLAMAVFASSGAANPGTKEAPIHNEWTPIWRWGLMTVFVGGIASAIITNKKWLIWKAHNNDVKWYVQAAASQRGRSGPTVPGYDPNAAAAAAFNQQPYPATATQQFSAPAPQAPAATVDLNSASAQELVTALGVDSETARRILQARQAAGSFTSFEQLMTKAQVPPHVLIPHRDKISFGAPAGPAPAASPQAQTLDPNSRKARRLFD